VGGDTVRIRDRASERVASPEPRGVAGS
jgi:hypothetical protein